MGCFIACLGGTRKQKRRISQPHHQGLGSYQQLRSASVKLDVKENNSTCHEPDSQLKKPTLRSVLGASKKVSFNLNVKTYEVIDSQEEEDEIPEKKENEKVGAAGENESTTSYPSNYRYKNFIDCENEEEEDDVVDEDEDFDDCLEDCLSDQSSIQGKGVFGLRKVHSVLSPVENTAQWRAVKVKTTTAGGGQSRHQCKENATLDHTFIQQEETRVDASLSSWIVGTI
ncbi:hypothetical protein QQ045_007267 [Rhodiola kirilowii]